MNDANSNGNRGSHNTNGSKNSNGSNSRNVSIRKILMIMIGMIAAKPFALTYLLFRTVARRNPFM